MTLRKEKMLITSIFSFSQDVFYPYQNKFEVLSHILSSVNAFNLDKSKILSFGKELILYLVKDFLLTMFSEIVICMVFNPLPEDKF